MAQEKLEEQFRSWAEKRGVPIIREESHELLRELVEKYNPKHILEIGTAVGYSGITMLESSNADLITIELKPESAEEAKLNFEKVGFSDRVNVVNADCCSYVIELLLDDSNIQKFDFIFLDGPKAQYLNLYPTLYELLAPNGVLVADNVLFRGYVENPSDAPRRFKTIYQRLKKFIDLCQTSGDFKFVKLHRIEDGVLECVKK